MTATVNILVAVATVLMLESDVHVRNIIIYFCERKGAIVRVVGSRNGGRESKGVKGQEKGEEFIDATEGRK